VNQNNIPFVRVGGFEGRSGIALGPTAYGEINPAPWMGVYALVGQSEISGYQTQGVNAHAKDLSAGMGGVVRSPERKRMRFGSFFQTQYFNSIVGASYLNGQGGVATYRQSNHDYLMTGGLDFELRLSRHTSLFVRPGENFRGGLAASQGHGFYFAGGLAVDPLSVVKEFKF
jgi:hypothetical protein